MAQQITPLPPSSDTVINRFDPSISSDGTRVAYEGNTASFTYVYSYDQTTSSYKLLSTVGGVEDNTRFRPSSTDNTASDPSSSASGNDVAFSSAYNYGFAFPPSKVDEIFRANVASGAVTLVSTTPDGTPADRSNEVPAVSSDGSVIGFTSNADNLGLGSPDTAANAPYFEAYLKNASSGVLSLVSETQGGAVAANNASGNPSYSSVTGFSADDKYAVLTSDAANLAPGLTSSDSFEVYVKNLSTGELRLVSQDSQSNIAASSAPVINNGSISANGNLVAFATGATNLKPNNSTETVANSEIYVKNLSTGSLNLVSSTSAGSAGMGGDSNHAKISADGKYVIFDSTATNFPAANGKSQVYVKNLITGSLTLVSKDGTGAPANGYSYVSSSSSGQAFSADDTQLVFSSESSNIAPSLGRSAVKFTFDPAPTITLDPVASIDASGGPVTGTTTNAVSDTVKVFLDDLSGPAIGTGTVGSDGRFSVGVTPVALAAVSQGTHTLLATVQGDPNVFYLSGSDQRPVTVDTIAPTVSITSAGGTTNQPNQTIAGKGEPNTTVALFDNGGTTALGGPVTVGGDGSFSIGVTLPSQGGNDIVAKDTDPAGNVGSSNTVGFNLDTIAPTVSITSAGGTTNQPSQTIAGKGEPNTTVSLFDNGGTSPLGGPVTVGGDGSFSIGVTLPIQGGNDIVAKDTDPAGNVGSSNSVGFNLDTIAPTVSITSAGGTTNQPSQTIAGKGEPNTTVSLFDNGGTSPLGGPVAVGGDGSFSIGVTLPSQGGNDIVAKDTDPAGNVGSSNSVGFNLDTIAPTVSITSAGGTTNQPNQMIAGKGEPNTTVSLFDNGGTSPLGGPVAVGGDGSFSIGVTLPSQGGYDIVAKDTDPAGNVGSSNTVAFDLDSVPPTVAFTPGVTFSNAHTATLMGTVSDPFNSPQLEVAVYDGAGAAAHELGIATVNGDGTWTLANVHLGTGPHDLTAIAAANGRTSAPVSPLFTLETGIRGLPYSAAEEDVDSQGNLVSEIFTKSNGAVFQSDFVTNRPNGDHVINYDSGTYFDNKDYFYQKDLFAANYGLKLETLYNKDGTHSETAFVDGQHLGSISRDIMTGNGFHESFVFKNHFGPDAIQDFVVGGRGHDVISLSSCEFSTAAQVLNHTQDVNGNAVIHVTAHDSITLDGVTRAELKLHPHDFKFHL